MFVMSSDDLTFYISFDELNEEIPRIKVSSFSRDKMLWLGKWIKVMRRLKTLPVCNFERSKKIKLNNYTNEINIHSQLAVWKKL